MLGEAEMCLAYDNDNGRAFLTRGQGGYRGNERFLDKGINKFI